MPELALGEGQTIRNGGIRQGNKTFLFFLVNVKHTSSVLYRSKALELWEWELVLYIDIKISGDVLRFTFSTTLISVYPKSFSELEKLHNQGNLQHCCSQEVS